MIPDSCLLPGSLLPGPVPVSAGHVRLLPPNTPALAPALSLSAGQDPLLTHLTDQLPFGPLLLHARLLSSRCLILIFLFLQHLSFLFSFLPLLTFLSSYLLLYFVQLYPRSHFTLQTCSVHITAISFYSYSPVSPVLIRPSSFSSLSGFSSFPIFMLFLFLPLFPLFLILCYFPFTSVLYFSIHLLFSLNRSLGLGRFGL